jgi:hypothetical protein
VCADFNRSSALKRLSDEAPSSGVKTVAVVARKIPVARGVAADGAVHPKATCPTGFVLVSDMIAGADSFFLGSEI